MTERIFVLNSSLDSDTISRKTKDDDEPRGKLLKSMLARKIQEWSQQSTRYISHFLRPKFHINIFRIEICVFQHLSHGIPNLAADSKNIIMRLMWTGFLLISIGICAFMIVKSISEYVEYDVTTKIREVLS